MEKGADLVLVCGATGSQGGAVADELLKAEHRIRIMTRRPDSEAARALAARGAEVVKADLDDEASLRTALDGAWGTFAVQNTWEAGVEGEEEQGKRFARVAREQGVHHYVYTSVASAHRNTGIPHFDNKFRVEETVRSLDFPSHAILRPVFFMENLTGPDFRRGVAEGRLALALPPEKRLQMIAVRDIGRYGRLAFERHEELAGRGIDIAGDELSGPEMADTLSEVTGRRIEFEHTPMEQVRAFSEEYAVMFEWFDRVGYDVDIAGNQRAWGIRPTPFREWAAGVDWG